MRDEVISTVEEAKKSIDAAPIPQTEKWPIADSLDVEYILNKENHWVDDDLAKLQNEMLRCGGSQMITLLATMEKFFETSDIRQVRSWIETPVQTIGRGTKSTVADRVSQNANAGALLHHIEMIGAMGLDPGFITVMDVYHHVKLAMELCIDLLGEGSDTFQRLLKIRSLFAMKKGYTHGDLWKRCAALVPPSRFGEGNKTSAKRFLVDELKEHWSSEFKDWQKTEPRKTVRAYVDLEQRESRLFDRAIMTPFEMQMGTAAGVNAQIKAERKRRRSRSRSRSSSRTSGSQNGNRRIKNRR